MLSHGVQVEMQYKLQYPVVVMTEQTAKNRQKAASNSIPAAPAKQDNREV